MVTRPWGGGGGGIGSSSSPCDDHVYSWQPRQITFAASVQEIASDYVAAQSQYLIDASSLFRATVFGQSKHASYVLKPRTTLLKRRPSLWSLVSLPPRLGWKRWLEDASVLKRCPHSAAAHHFAFLFLLFFFFLERVCVNILGVSLVSSLVISFNPGACVSSSNADRRLLGVSEVFLCLFFLNGTSRRNSGTSQKERQAGPEINFACYGVQGSDPQVDPVCSFLTCVCLEEF